MYTWQNLAEVGYFVVRQEVIYDGHTMYLAIESICMTSLLEQSAKIEDASLSVE